MSAAGRRPWLWVAALLVCLAIVVALPLLQRHRSKSPAVESTPSPFRAIALDQAQRPDVLDLAFDPAGDRAFMADLEGLARLGTTPLGEGRARPTGVLGWTGLGMTPPIDARVSDDGRFVVAVGPGGDIVPADIIDVGSRAVVAHVTTACREIAVSHDGRIAVTHDGWPSLGLRAWDLASGTSREGPKVRTGSYDVTPPALTLDVSSAAGLVLHCFRGTTGVWDLTCGATHDCPTRLNLAHLVGDSGLVVGFEESLSRDSPTRVTEWDPAHGTVRVLWTGREHVWLDRSWVSPRGRLLVAHAERGLAVWSLEKLGEPRFFDFPAPRPSVVGLPVTALAFTRDERSLVVALVGVGVHWLDLDR